MTHDEKFEILAAQKAAERELSSSTDQPDPIANRRPALLPFDPADMVSMRVKPAEFARMVGVSRTAVSQWIKEGKVTRGPDGLLDPVKASREVMANTNPAQLRARVFKQAMEPYGELQARVKELETENQALKVALEHWEQMRTWMLDLNAIEARRAAFVAALIAGFDEMTAAVMEDRVDDWLDWQWGVHFLRCDPADLAETFREGGESLDDQP